jgi:hypothetical protein
MNQPRHRFVTNYNPPVTKEDVARQRQAEATELARTRDELAAARHRISILERTNAAAVILLTQVSKPR